MIGMLMLAPFRSIMFIPSMPLEQGKTDLCKVRMLENYNTYFSFLLIIVFVMPLYNSVFNF